MGSGFICLKSLVPFYRTLGEMSFLVIRILYHMWGGFGEKDEVFVCREGSRGVIKKRRGLRRHPGNRKAPSYQKASQVLNTHAKASRSGSDALASCLL